MQKVIISNAHFPAKNLRVRGKGRKEGWGEINISLGNQGKVFLGQ